MTASLARCGFCFAVLIGPFPSMAAEWQGQLLDGSRVEVDPRTHRAWQLDAGRRIPLWDGVHRLADGSVVIVKGGTAVPQAQMLDAWSREDERPRPQPIPADCERLVERVCGKEAQCDGAEPCRLARQLRSMAEESGTTDAVGGLAGQCREALANGFFTPCD